MNLSKRQPSRWLSLGLILFTLCGLMLRSNIAAAQDASPVVSPPSATSTVAPTQATSTAPATTAPTVTPTSAVQGGATTGTVDLTVRIWTCPDTTGGVGSSFYDVATSAPDRSADGCALIPSNGLPDLPVNLEDASSNPIATTQTNGGVAVFQDLTPGDYFVASDIGSFSFEFPATLAGETTPLIDVIFNGDSLSSEQIILPVEYLTCENAAKAGTYDFLVQTLSFGSASTSTSNCTPGALATDPVTSVQLNGTTTYGPNPINSYGGTTFGPIVAGDYTATVLLGGTPTATSDSFAVAVSFYAPTTVQIIHYVAANTLVTPTPNVNGTGSLEVIASYCDDPDRAGDVEFLVNTAFYGSDATSNCEVAPFVSSNLELTNTSTQTTYRSVAGYYYYGGSLFQNLPPGTYVLTNLDAGATSDPFTIPGGTTSSVQMNIYSAPPQLGLVLVVPMTCLDPARAGQTEYTVLGNYGIGASSTSNCTETFDSGATPETFTITNTVTGDTYTTNDFNTSSGEYYVVVPAGTYTVTSESGAVSDSFQVTATSYYYYANFTVVIAKEFVGNDDFTPVPTADPQDGYSAEFDLLPYLCTTNNPDKVGAEFLIVNEIYSGVSVGAAAPTPPAPTQNCSPGATQAFQFEAIPVGGGNAIPLVIDGSGSSYEYSFPSGTDVTPGTYVIHEITTDTSSEPVYLSDNYTFGFFLLSTLNPTPTPTATIVPTETPTAVVGETGANITLQTADGGNVPDTGTICIGDTCQSTGTTASAAGFSAAAASGSAYFFTGLTAGTFPITVTGVTPYQDYSGTITIADGQVASQTITLSQVVLAPTEPGNATPVVNPTSAPGQPTATSAPAKPGPTVAVKSLPNTGQGTYGTTDRSVALLLFALTSLLLAAFAIGMRRRRA